MMSNDPPVYIHGPLMGMSDRYEEDEWRQIWDGFDLDDGYGFLYCSECGEEVHCYGATRDDPGYNENTGQNYIMYNHEVIICADCLYNAFSSFREAVEHNRCDLDS